MKEARALKNSCSGKDEEKEIDDEIDDDVKKDKEAYEVTKNIKRLEKMIASLNNKEIASKEDDAVVSDRLMQFTNELKDMMQNIEDEKSDKWYDLIKKHYIINGEIVYGRIAEKFDRTLQKRINDIFDITQQINELEQQQQQSGGGLLSFFLKK